MMTGSTRFDLYARQRRCVCCAAMNCDPPPRRVVDRLVGPRVGCEWAGRNSSTGSRRVMLSRELSSEKNAPGLARREIRPEPLEVPPASSAAGVVEREARFCAGVGPPADGDHGRPSASTTLDLRDRPPPAASSVPLPARTMLSRR